MDPWSQTIIAALKAVRPLVLHVVASDADESVLSFGSGLALDHYHVVTTAQVVPEGQTRIQVVGADRRTYAAEVVGRDPLYFLVVLRVDRRLHMQWLPWGNSDELQSGQLAVAVGNPLGIDHTVSLGLISAADRSVYRPERFPVDGLIVTDAALHAGNLGGALADLQGQVVGVVGVSWAAGVGYAVQGNVAARIANQLIEFGQASHPWLGFSGRPEMIEPAVVELLSLPVGDGLLVTHVADGGPGDRAGVRPMDLVVRVRERPVATVSDVRKALSLQRPGAEVPLVVFRGGDLLELTMPVEQMPGLFDDS